MNRARILPLLILLTLMTSAIAQVAAPQFSPPSATDVAPFSVVVTCTTSGASIYYSTDGTNPDLIHGPTIQSGSSIFVDHNLTLSAQATLGGTSSAITSQDYLVTGAIVGGGMHTLALTAIGGLYSWGNQLYGCLGNNQTASAYLTTPQQVLKLTGSAPFTDAIAVGAGLDHSLAIDRAGYVYSFGNNTYGQLGNNTLTGTAVAVHALTGTSGGSGIYLGGAVAVAGGESFSLALSGTGAGEVWSWGLATLGRLGNGVTSGNYKTAGFVYAGTSGSTHLTGVVNIAAGETFALAQDANGNVWSWGDNTYGQLGDGTTTAHSRAQLVKDSGSNAITNIVAVGAGQAHSVALRQSATENGTVWCWGYQGSGRLGNNQSAGANIKNPIPVLTGSAGIVTGTLNHIVQIAVGPRHTLALDRNGQVFAWGDNAYGQLGDGTTTDRATATQVPLPVGTVIIYVGAGGNSGTVSWSFAIAKDGTIYSWGHNTYGELGISGTTASPQKSPVVSAGAPKMTKQLPSLALSPSTGPFVAPLNLTLTVTANTAVGSLSRIDLYNYSTLLQTASSTPAVYVWNGMLSGTYSFSAVAVETNGVSGSSAVQTITVVLPTLSLSTPVSTAIEPDGVSYSGTAGSFRISRTYSGAPPNVALDFSYSVSGSATPGIDYVALSGSATIPSGAAYVDVPVTPLIDMQVEGAETVTLTLNSQAAYTTGSSSSASVTIQDTPPTIAVSNTADAGYSSVAAPVNGNFRFTRSGPLGPLTVPYSVNTLAVSGSDYVGLSGTVSFPQDGSTVDVPVTPILGTQSSKALALNITSLSTYVIASGSGRATMNLQMPTGKVTGGCIHALGMKSNGTLYSWGNQADGRLGNNQTGVANISTPLPVLKLTGSDAFTDAFAIGAGFDHSLAVDRSGYVYSFGNNTYGQLGNNTLNGAAVASHVFLWASGTLSGAAAVACGKNFSLALSGSGAREVWSWGLGTDGRLGNGTTSGNFSLAGNVWTGTSGVTNLTGICGIAAGEDFALAQGGNGRAWSWGNNAYGQLGDGTTSSHSRAMPVQFSDGTPFTDVVAVAAGRMHSVALRQSATENGTVWAWGYQGSGRLGNNQSVAANIKNPAPVLTGSAGIVTGTLSNIVQIAAGPDHTLALDKDGQVWAWGDNTYGQLGNNTTTDSLYAMKVPFPTGAGGPPVIRYIGAGGAINGSIYSFSFAIANDGSFYAWGHNSFGELGLTGNLTTPIKVPTTDFFNGISTLLSKTGGDNQTSPAQQFLMRPLEVLVTGTTGQALVNAPVTFTVTQGGGSLALAKSGTALAWSTLVVLTGTDGKAKLYYQHAYSNSRTGTIRAVAGTAAPVSFTANVGNGLAAYWKFEEGSGVSALDSSGGGNQGTLTSGTLWKQGFDGGGAVDFSGSNSMSVNDSTNQVIPVDGAAFSISLWLRQNAAVPGTMAALMGNDDYTHSGFRFGVDTGSFHPEWGGQSRVIFWSGQSGGTIDLLTQTAIQSGQWYHVAVTYSGSSAKIYINGALEGTSTGTILSNAYPLYVAAGIEGITVQKFNGRIDDLRIYQGELSASDVAGLHNLDSDPNGIPDWWEMLYFGHTNVDPNAPAPRGDGPTNLQAYQLGLDPIHPSPLTLYVNSAIGNDAYSGFFSDVIAGPDGPKLTIGSALGNSFSGDSLQLAAGTYTETSLHPGSKAIHLVPNGVVHIH